MRSAVLCPKCGSYAAWSDHFKCYICSNVACAWAGHPSEEVKALNRGARIDSGTVSQLFEILGRIDGFTKDAESHMKITCGLDGAKEALKGRLEELDELRNQVRRIINRVVIEELIAEAEKLSAEIKKQLEELLPEEYLRVA